MQVVFLGLAGMESFRIGNDMRSEGLVRARLRAATQDAHARVDHLFSDFDLTEVSGYRRFLLAQAAAYIPAEAALDRNHAGRVIGDWEHRRRAGDLRSDLEALDLTEPMTFAEPDITNDAAMLGMAYVLEGSRLGGAVLRRSIPRDFPTRFLSAGTPDSWARFLRQLEAALPTEASIHSAIEAAGAIFAMFERSARHYSTAVAIGR